MHLGVEMVIDILSACVLKTKIVDCAVHRECYNFYFMGLSDVCFFLICIVCFVIYIFTKIW